MKCRWCGETLRFERGRGWVHLDGKLVRTRLDPDGIERDDHVALAVDDDEEIEERSDATHTRL